MRGRDSSLHLPQGTVEAFDLVIDLFISHEFRGTHRGGVTAPSSWQRRSRNCTAALFFFCFQLGFRDRLLQFFGCLFPQARKPALEVFLQAALIPLQQLLDPLYVVLYGLRIVFSGLKFVHPHPKDQENPVCEL